MFPAVPRALGAPSPSSAGAAGVSPAGEKLAGGTLAVRCLGVGGPSRTAFGVAAGVLLLVLAAPSAGAAAAGEPEAARRADDPPDRIYTFSELLATAETIVLAEAGEPANGALLLRVVSWLKGPPDDLKGWQDAALAKRARARLDEEAQRLKAVAEKTAGEKAGDPAEPPPAPPEAVRGDELRPPLAVLIRPGFPAPRAGAQALYFLWDRAKATADEPLRYQLSHPQNLYQASLAAEVKAELTRPRNAERRRYLDDGDQRLAERLARREGDQALRQMPAGNLERGMRLTIRVAQRAEFGPADFTVVVQIENSRDNVQAIYDGLLGGFGVRARKKGAPPESATVLRLTDRDLTRGLDPWVLAVVDAGDFVGVPKNDRWLKELRFTARDYPGLAGWSGEYVLNAFYTSTQDGKGLPDLPGVPWTGTLVSEDFALTFGGREPAAGER